MHIVDFYTQLLGTAIDIQITEFSFARASVEMGDYAMMIQILTKDQIKHVFWSIPIQKALGPYGYNSCFFRTAWNIVGEEICLAIRDFFINGKILKRINAIVISLIPKVEAPNTIQEYRPIACCNMVYKVISKLLVSKLQSILGGLVGEEQVVFIPGGYLQDNVIMTHLLVNGYNRKHISPRAMIKVDIRKAYDSIEWKFIRYTLQVMKFPASFTTLIMNGITSPTFSLNINGHLEGGFHGGRGLRQGDPISPCIFVLCIEMLSRLLRHATDHRNIHYHPKCAKMKISHLKFADDLLLFARGDLSSIKILTLAFLKDLEICLD